MRAEHYQVCPKCGHRPSGEGLLVAWLLSSHHLDEAALKDVSERIAGGEAIRPTERMLNKARRASGMTFGTDPGLTNPQRMALLATSLLLTPLLAWACFGCWLTTHPRSAWQSFSVALPGTLVYGALGLWILIGV